MHAYFRNHQLYLAERCNWLDRQVTKTSSRALMKIESYKLIVQAEENNVQVKLIDQCGHLPQIEYSDMFNVAALSFLAEVDRSEIRRSSPMASAVNIR